MITRLFSRSRSGGRLSATSLPDGGRRLWQRLALPDRTEHRYQHGMEPVGAFNVLVRQDIRERSRS